MPLNFIAPILALLATAHAVPLAGAAKPVVEDSPSGEDLTLLIAAGLPEIDRRGDVIRYVLHRGFYGKGTPTARLVQADWTYGAKHPRVLRIELNRTNEEWRVVERKEAAMEPRRFDRLVSNVAAAASVVRDPPHRGTMLICSHANTSRFDLSLPDERRMRITRGAHCSNDAPAVVAGELLAAAVDLDLKRAWQPEPN